MVIAGHGSHDDMYVTDVQNSPQRGVPKCQLSSCLAPSSTANLRVRVECWFLDLCGDADPPDALKSKLPFFAI